MPYLTVMAHDSSLYDSRCAALDLELSLEWTQRYVGF